MTDPAGSARDAALDRLKARRAFNAGLVSYVIVNVFLWIIWAITGGGGSPPWPIWVTVGWGVGMAFGAWNVYGRKPITDADIDREMRRGR